MTAVETFAKRCACIALVFVTGCAITLRPENPNAALIVIDSGVDPKGWSLSVSDRTIDGAGLGFFRSSGEYPPGPRRVSVAWNLTSDGEEDFVGIDLLASKSGFCSLTLMTEPGRAYILTVRASSGGDWFSEPTVYMNVSDGMKPWGSIGETPCRYSGRSVTPGWVNNH